MCIENFLKSFWIHLSACGAQYYLKINRDQQNVYVRTRIKEAVRQSVDEPYVSQSAVASVVFVSLEVVNQNYAK